MSDEVESINALPPSPRIDKLVGALAKAQGEITNPPRNRSVTVRMKAGGSYTFKYATLDSIIEHVRKPLTSNGLWFTQTLEGADNGKYRLVTTLVHESGQRIDSVTPLLVQEAGNQAFGSALSYMRRYALCSILGVASDEDDDANAADGNVAQQNSVPPRPKRPSAASKPAAPTIDRATEIADAEGVSPDEAMQRAAEEAEETTVAERNDELVGAAEESGKSWWLGETVPAEPKRIPVPVGKQGQDWLLWKEWVVSVVFKAPSLEWLNGFAEAIQPDTKAMMADEPELAQMLKSAFDNQRGALAQAPEEAA